MALFRRGKWWWTDFSVNGVRYRQPVRDEHGQRTKDWRQALSREKELIAEAEAGKLAASSQQFARLSFKEAADRYIADRIAHLEPRSLRTEQERLKPLRTSLESTPLTRRSGETVREYIGQRKRSGAANRTVNMEIGVLRRILKRAKRWHFLADDIPHLRERDDVGRALTLEEKIRLLQLVASKPEWETARLATILALNTTMRGCELKGLRWRDVDLIERTLTVQRVTTKTDAGERVIPLNPDAWVAILELRDRAKQWFGDNPQANWFVFPHAEGKSKPDPTRPMSGWRSAWRSLTRAVVCLACGTQQQPGMTCVNADCKADIQNVRSSLHGLRFHDLRHHAITELAEGQASDRTIMSIAGHISPKMLERYSHVRIEAKRRALESLSGKSSAGGYVTKHVTKSPDTPQVELQTVVCDLTHR